MKLFFKICILNVFYTEQASSRKKLPPTWGLEKNRESISVTKSLSLSFECTLLCAKHRHFSFKLCVTLSILSRVWRGSAGRRKLSSVSGTRARSVDVRTVGET